MVLYYKTQSCLFCTWMAIALNGYHFLVLIIFTYFVNSLSLKYFFYLNINSRTDIIIDESWKQVILKEGP